MAYQHINFITPCGCIPKQFSSSKDIPSNIEEHTIDAISQIITKNIGSDNIKNTKTDDLDGYLTFRRTYRTSFAPRLIDYSAGERGKDHIESSSYWMDEITAKLTHNSICDKCKARDLARCINPIAIAIKEFSAQK